MNITEKNKSSIDFDLTGIESILLPREVELGIQSPQKRVEGIWRNFCLLFSRIFEFFKSFTWKPENQVAAKILRNLVPMHAFCEQNKDLDYTLKKPASNLVSLIERLEMIREVRLRKECGGKENPQLMPKYKNLYDELIFLNILANTRPPVPPRKNKPQQTTQNSNIDFPEVEVPRQWAQEANLDWDKDCAGSLEIIRNFFERAVKGGNNGAQEMRKMLEESLKGLFATQYAAMKEVNNKREGIQFYETKIMSHYKKEHVFEDGDCFVHALIKQLNINVPEGMEGVLHIRKEIADFYETKLNDEEYKETFSNLQINVAQVRQTATKQENNTGWLGTDHAVIVKLLYKRPVHVFSPNDQSFGKKEDVSKRPLPGDNYLFDLLPNDPEEVKNGWNPEPIRLLHNGHDHWDPLFLAEQSSQ